MTSTCCSEFVSIHAFQASMLADLFVLCQTVQHCGGVDNWAAAQLGALGHSSLTCEFVWFALL